jgi:hypothetical protein
MIGSLFLFLLPGLLHAQNYEFHGQASGWFSWGNQASERLRLGGRYIPAFSLQKSLSKNVNVDFELSLNAYGNGYLKKSNDFETDGDIKPYRVWIRFSTSQFETRVGLQKINFGPALLLRSLMWFDRIDPRDPLQITDGVYGVLMRYYFLNNANIWIWGLFNNENKTKGWEILASKQDSWEYGGRAQAPLLTGELGLTYHHRTIGDQDLIDLPAMQERYFPENRYAVDGRWDVGIGLWFEASMIHQKIPDYPYRYRKTFTLGMDYTFGFGNGVHVLSEHFEMVFSRDAWGSGEKTRFTALSLDYPLGLLDQVRLMVYYDWDNRELYRFISWQRTYDKWSFYIMGYWNPEKFLIYQNQDQVNLFTGIGIQIMAVFNH